jgi:hypothetical protein
LTHIWSTYALLLTLFLGANQLIFPPKHVPCRFSLKFPLFGCGPLSSKGLEINLKLLTNKIAWIHWSLDLGPSSKVTLNLLENNPIIRTKGLHNKELWIVLKNLLANKKKAICTQDYKECPCRPKGYMVLV